MKRYFALFLIFFFCPLAHSFPENIRHGYASCKSCHYAPTGGGTLTPYGRRLTEEVQSMWGKEPAADTFYGAVTMPDKLQLGGDFRSIAYKRETETYRESRRFLMQADLEVVAPKIWKDLSAAVNGGYYDEEGRLRRFYLMYDFSQSLSLRAGQFLPSFGVNTPEHETATKRPLGFNEGSEVPTMELSFTEKNFEVFLSAFSGSKGEKRNRDTGASLTAALFLGQRSKIGLSLYQGDGDIHRRFLAGPYAIIGFTERLYLLSELDYQKRMIKEKDKALIEDEEGIFSANKFGYEIVQGLHTFLTYETARPTASESETFFDSYGGGLTWYPYPHFETQFTYGTMKNPGPSRPKGDMWLAMMHYYL